MSVHEAQGADDAVAADDPLQLGEHALLRHPRRPLGRSCGPARASPGSATSPSSAARRTRRTTRSGSSANDARPDHAQAAGGEVAGAAVRVDALAAAQRLGDRVDGEVAQREVGLQRAAAQRAEVGLPAAVGGQHAPRAERVGELEQRAARGARERAGGGPTSPSTTRSRSVVGRPRMSSRTAPPTSQALRPASASRASERASLIAAADPVGAGAAGRSRRHAVVVVDPRHAREQAARHLVVDRPQPPGDLLGGDPLLALRADEHRGVADRGAPAACRRRA